MRRRVLMLTIATAAVSITAWLLATAGGRTLGASAPTTSLRTVRPEAAQPEPTPFSSDLTLTTVVRKFARAYAAYLDGGSGKSLTTAGSITAAAQARQEGSIPAPFRDGTVGVQQLDSLNVTCCSATVTVVLANREERYPFAEQLLLGQHGWRVDQITPADLSMDRHLQPAPHVSAPAAGIDAARVFAVQYANYRSGHSPTPPAITRAAAKQISAHTDALAGQKLPDTAAHLTSIEVGPPTGSEFAATATVLIGDAHVTFSFLMLRTATGWKCGQFL